MIHSLYGDHRRGQRQALKRATPGDQGAEKHPRRVDVSLAGVRQNRSDPPWPRQSIAATAKPRLNNSPTTSKYFSMNSPRPPSRTTVPMGDNGAQRAVRKRTPSAARISPSGAEVIEAQHREGAVLGVTGSKEGETKAVHDQDTSN
jgi:hypothetical protein